METIRDSTFGDFVRLVAPRLLPHPEELPNYAIPKMEPGASDESTEEPTDSASSAPTLNDDDNTLSPAETQQQPPTVVGWYGPSDPANPLNWSLTKKCWTTFVIMYYTFAVYVGSAIFAYAIDDAAHVLGVSQTVATLGITFFVLGYAVGPLFLAPLSEVPAIGRNPPYMLSLLVFCVVQIPSALATNFPALAVLRFIAGFAGSPPLATGGASLTDIFTEQKAGYALGIYGIAAGIAPAVAPLISGFAVQSLGWRWAFWELLIMSGVGLVLVFFGLPETSADNILYRRAARLRALTGNNTLRSASEIADAERKFSAVMKEALVRPLVMTVTEPIVLAIDLYIGLTYAVLYSYFESFPLVYVTGYGWGLGVAGLPFLALTIGAMVSYVIYCVWAYKCWEPQYVEAEGKLAPEAYLPLSIPGAFCYPVTLFWFAWTANRTSWVSPTIASSIFGLGDCLSFMPFLNYLTVAYPKYAASALASNDFVRSIMGAAMPIVARPLFNNLGIDWGNSVLGFITVAFLPIPFILIKWGPWLRMRSPMATHYEVRRKGDKAKTEGSEA